MVLEHPADALARFAAVACLREADGYEHTISTPSVNFAELQAQAPLGAAQKWYWRLAEAERAACWLVVVGPWTFDNPFGYRVYDGPPVAYMPKDHWREVSACGSVP